MIHLPKTIVFCSLLGLLNFQKTWSLVYFIPKEIIAKIIVNMFYLFCPCFNNDCIILYSKFIIRDVSLERYSKFHCSHPGCHTKYARYQCITCNKYTCRKCIGCTNTYNDDDDKEDYICTICHKPDADYNDEMEFRIENEDTLYCIKCEKNLDYQEWWFFNHEFYCVKCYKSLENKGDNRFCLGNTYPISED
jgi:hypothetical protein